MLQEFFEDSAESIATIRKVKAEVKTWKKNVARKRESDENDGVEVRNDIATTLFSMHLSAFGMCQNFWFKVG